MKTFTCLLVAVFVVVAFTHKSEADGTRDYVLGYLKSLHTGANEADLKGKKTPELVDLVVAALQKLQGETEDTERKNALGEHIKSFEKIGTSSGAQDTHESPLEAVTKVHHVESEEDFDNQLKNAGNKVVLVDFFATWCMPCVTITPYLDAFAEKYSGRLLILKVDVDELNDLAMERFKVDAMPTFIYFKNGEIVDRWSGGSDAKIEAAIQKYTA